MTVTVTKTTGPDEGAFLYLRGEVAGVSQVTRVRSVALAALADGSLTVAGEKAALIAEVEQALTNWQAAQAALMEL